MKIGLLSKLLLALSCIKKIDRLRKLLQDALDVIVVSIHQNDRIVATCACAVATTRHEDD